MTGRLPSPELRDSNTGDLQGFAILLTTGLIGLLATPVIRLIAIARSRQSDQIGVWSLRALGVMAVSVALGLFFRR
jgi:hypothetical protein